MIASISQFNPVVQALAATWFTWGVTTLGACIVVFTKRVNPVLMDTSLGFAGGVMIAASYWSLLAPAIEMAEQAGMIPWVPAAVGFVGGALFMRLVDMILPFALAFAAGAMIFVVIEEVIPESQRGNHGDIASIGTVLGFATMMILDVALG